ncbi:MAG: hypothetical protein LBN01_01205 [Endomicrobium sp.]|jgi:large-conductance mechanosensitive channel|nr:hypothetical protein [Endomicrobium sp.]
MKKLIILLMAVSIMLTSCGKSTGLSNSDKRANKTLANAKQPCLHPAINFVCDHYVYVILGFIVVAAVGFVVVKLINNKSSNNNLNNPKEKPPTEEEQHKEGEEQIQQGTLT